MDMVQYMYIYTQTTEAGLCREEETRPSVSFRDAFANAVNYIVNRLTPPSSPPPPYPPEPTATAVKRYAIIHRIYVYLFIFKERERERHVDHNTHATEYLTQKAEQQIENRPYRER